jgi:trans-2,3-dihydro-3-hydroxyanthranilate isomerase
MLARASNGTRAMAYVFAREDDQVLCRFFFPKHGAMIEDPGTGSACANLGGWLLATGAPLPQKLSLSQGEAVERPCHIGLEVTADRSIRVSGRVIELGTGTVHL